MKRYKLFAFYIIALQVVLISFAVEYSDILCYQFGGGSEEGLSLWSQYIEYYKSSEVIGEAIEFCRILKNTLVIISLVIVVILLNEPKSLIPTKYKVVVMLVGVGAEQLTNLYFRLNEGMYPIITEFITVEICAAVITALLVKRICLERQHRIDKI